MLSFEVGSAVTEWLGEHPVCLTTVKALTGSTVITASGRKYNTDGLSIEGSALYIAATNMKDAETSELYLQSRALHDKLVRVLEKFRGSATVGTPSQLVHIRAANFVLGTLLALL